MYDFFFHGFDAVQITGLLFSAILIGINKTGIPGIGTLPVVILSLLFPAKFSTGLQLVMLCTGDLAAVAYHHRNADWKLLLKLLPCTLVGIGLGTLTLRLLDDRTLSITIGSILILLSGLYFFKTFYLKSESIPTHWSFAAAAGITAGFATQIANAAGPVMALYLLSMRFDKKQYMGTCALFFLIMNFIKLPIFISEGRIIPQSFLMDLPMLPALGIGAFLGIWFFKKISQQAFETIIHVVVILSSAWLIVSKLI